MAWEFETDPEFQEKLDWITEFVREEIEPLDVLAANPNARPYTDDVAKIVEPLQAEVRRQRLWACHLGPELGGEGYGQVKLALMNEILGRSSWGPTIFGTQAPDTGNAEILAHFGTDDQKKRYLEPLLAGEITSCYSMTEPQGGADPAVFTTTAVRDGDSYLINGWKFFSSNARWATFLVVMAITDPSVDLYHRTSMFLVPSDTPGVNIVRNVGLGHDAMNDGSHALIHYDNVRVPAESLLGNEGQAFVIAQTRLGGGRVHHAMRTVGQAQRAFDMLCERALSRTTKGELLAEKQSVQNYIADSYSQITQFRLFLLYVAWRIDKLNDYRKVRHDIAAIKALMPQVLHDVVQRSMQVHGALGVSNELPLSKFWEASAWLALADGPSEVHRITVARQVLRNYSPAPGMWPTEWIPARQEAAREKFAELLEHEVGNF